MKHLSILASALLGLALVATAGAQNYSQTESNTNADGSVQTSIQATAVSSDGSDATVRIETKTEASSKTETVGSSKGETTKDSSSASGHDHAEGDTHDPDHGYPDRPVIVGSAPNDDKKDDPDDEKNTGTELDDIGVMTADVDDDNDGDRSDKTSLIDRIAAPDSELRAVFIKIKDIDGESKDTANTSSTDEGNKGGNAETTWKVEKGEKAASKPKEIVVVGSKVRGWDPATKEEVLGVAPQTADEVQNETDLAFLLVRAAHDDENIGDVEVKEGEVRVEYFQPARLFGFIPVGLAHSVEVKTDPEAESRVKVRLPWWHILTVKDVQVDEEELREEVSFAYQKISASASAETDVQIQSQTFQTISNAMKTIHDTAKAAINNIR